jgi:copper(I)-binding protein
LTFRPWCRGAVVLLVAMGCRRAPALQGVTASAGHLALSQGVAWGLASSHSTTIGFRVSTTEADTLLGVESPDGIATLHDNVNNRMTPLARLPVPAGGAVVLGDGGPHIMVTETTHGYAPGDSIRLTLRWARQGPLTISLPLKNFSDASAILTGS